VVESGTASVSMIQRRLRVGYTRAGRLIDMLERRGIISGYEGSKPRQVLASAADLPRLLGGGDQGERASEGSDDETGDLEVVPAGD
jgi:S-DNA-T family DNA segregation ATPase FtsK/SpoIIIE